MVEPEAISLGLLGDYYSIRHALGHYTSACVTGVYCVAAHVSQDKVQDQLERSLQATIRQHPALCYGLADDKASDISTKFKQISKISRDDVIQVVHRDSDSDLIGGHDNSDAMLSRYLDVAHSKPWSLNKPAWTVIILYHDRRLARAALGPARSRIDIAFVAHHALSDGLSGVVFHQSLVQNLAHELKLDRPATWPLELTENVPPPKALEDLIKMDPSVAGTEDHDRQPIWAGRPTSLQAGDGEDGIRSRTRLITVYPQYLHKALQTCKREQITLTGLLHGLICVILSRQLAEAPGFRAITPYSIRRFTKASKDEIVNHIFYMSTPVTRPRLEAIRATVPLSPVERQLIFSVARTFNQAITKELNRFPHDSPIASIGRLGDILAHCRAQVGQAREDTYELSNLGVAENPSRVIINSPLVLEKLFMTQSAMVAGPALGINCVSIRDGAMTLSITWQHGIVEEWLVERLAQELESRLMAIL